LHHLHFVVREQPNNCTMTYMSPNYYPIPMFNASRLASRYRLFQYSHRELSKEEEALHSDKVLIFVPGSGGSFEQVRSVGKELIELVTAEGKPRSHVAIYTVDYAGEHSALSGMFIERQVEFLHDVVAQVKARHSDPNLQIVLFGHSMGGIVSRAFLERLDSSEHQMRSDVVALFTLSTPHVAPVVGADLLTFRLYKALDAHTDSERAYLSIGGGYRDPLVRGELTSLDRKRYFRAASALTSSIPEVDMSVDHLAVLWCNEVAKPIAKEILGVYMGRGAKLPLLEALQKKKVPRTGFAKKSAQSHASENWAVNTLVTEVIGRRHVLGVFQCVFALALVVLARAAGAPLLMLAVWCFGWWAAFVALWADHDSHWPIPLILAGAAVGIQASLLVVSKLFLSGLRLILPLLQLAASLGVVVLHLWQVGLPVTYNGMSELFWSSIVLAEFANIALLALACLGSVHVSVTSVLLGSAQDNWGVGDIQSLIGIAYLAALAGWVSPAMFSGSLTREPLLFLDEFPLDLYQGRAGKQHPVSRALIPASFLTESGQVASEAKAAPLFDSHGGLVWEEWAMLVFAAAAALPVLLHLSTVYYFPRFPSDEKVLDSQYERVKVAKKEAPKEEPFMPETAGSEPPSPDGAGKPGLRKRRKEKSTTSEVVEAVESPKGVLFFDDTSYSTGSEPVIIEFANGERIQMDLLDVIDAEKITHPDAIPLISDHTEQTSSGVACILVQRIRPASMAFPVARWLQLAILVLAFVSSILGPAYLFLLQVCAPAFAIVCLIAADGVAGPTERFVRKRVV